jgi:hypothetical protein
VLNHTKTKCKFWILENYLSPSFKEFIPQMAKEYGFEIGFVSYNWPSWLNKQTEKQRIMSAHPPRVHAHTLRAHSPAHTRAHIRIRTDAQVQSRTHTHKLAHTTTQKRIHLDYAHSHSFADTHTHTHTHTGTHTNLPGFQVRLKTCDGCSPLLVIGPGGATRF